jgi:hypothetical protein
MSVSDVTHSQALSSSNKFKKNLWISMKDIFMNTTHMQFSQRPCLMILSTEILGWGNRNSTKPNPLWVSMFPTMVIKKIKYTWLLCITTVLNFFGIFFLKYLSENFDGNYFWKFEIFKLGCWTPSFSEKQYFQQDLSNMICKYSMHLIKTLR